jgi:hypothetical protein
VTSGWDIGWEAQEEDEVVLGDELCGHSALSNSDKKQASG